MQRLWVKSQDEYQRRLDKEAEENRKRWDKEERKERKREQKRREEEEKRRRQQERQSAKQSNAGGGGGGGKGVMNPRTTVALVPGHWIDPGEEVGAPGERALNLVITNRAHKLLGNKGWTVLRPDLAQPPLVGRCASWNHHSSRWLLNCLINIWQYAREHL